MKVISIKNIQNKRREKGLKIFIEAKPNAKKFLEDTHFEIEFHSDNSFKFSLWHPFLSLKNKIKNLQGIVFSFNTDWNGKKYRINIKIER
ncbi:MAG: hypothetical protein AAB593_01160 [Patescibacteria group bacterium]